MSASQRSIEEIVEQAKYARRHAEASVVLPSVPVAWAKNLAGDVLVLAARIADLEAKLYESEDVLGDFDKEAYDLFSPGRIDEWKQRLYELRISIAVVLAAGVVSP